MPRMPAHAIADLDKKIALMRRLSTERSPPTSSNAPHRTRGQQIAHAIGITAETYSRFIHWHTPINDHYLMRICACFPGFLRFPPDAFLKPLIEFSAFSASYHDCSLSRTDLLKYKQAVATLFAKRTLFTRTINIETDYFPTTLDFEHSDQKGSPSLSAMTVLRDANRKHVCILAPAGFGKTACIRRFLWETQKDDSIPFVLQLKPYTTDVVNTGTIVIDDLFRSSISHYPITEHARTELAELMRQRRGVFIIDGLDFLRDNLSLSNTVLDALERFFAGSTDCRIIITTRMKSDLCGHFSYFDYLRIPPLATENIAIFVDSTNISISDHIIASLSKKNHTLSPFILLAAATFGDEGVNIRTFYDLVSKAINELLLKESDSHIPCVNSLFPHSIREMRRQILHSVILNWPDSTRPLRIHYDVLFGYFRSALTNAPIDLLSRFDGDEVAAFNHVVPTGICLASWHDDHERDLYTFTHDIIQEFLYAQMLFKQTSDGNPFAFRREYYSEDILELYGGQLTEDLVDTLLSWVADDGMDIMVRKVAARALGFVSERLAAARILPELRRLFVQVTDIGVAGRVAEARRRLGDETAMQTYIGKLDSYANRMNSNNSVDRPLNFEVNVPIRHVFDEVTYTILRKLSLGVTASKKHALIIWLRSERPPNSYELITYCTDEARKIVDNSQKGNNAANETNEAIRSLLYGLEGLGRLGTDAERRPIREIVKYIGNFSVKVIRDKTADILDRLKMRVWHSSKYDAGGLRLFLIRHGESMSNISARFAGQGDDPQLSPRGIAQANALAKRMRHVIGAEADQTIVIMSPATRSRMTGMAIVATIGCTYVEEPRLKEMDMGSWSGCLRVDVESNDSEKLKLWHNNKWIHAPTGGEILGQVKARVCASVAEHLNKVPDRVRNIIIVSHCYPIVALHEQITEDDTMKPDNCAISAYNLSYGKWTSDKVNDARHLKDIGFDPPGCV